MESSGTEEGIPQRKHAFRLSEGNCEYQVSVFHVPAQYGNWPAAAHPFGQLKAAATGRFWARNPACFAHGSPVAAAKAGPLPASVSIPADLAGSLESRGAVQSIPSLS